jgi:hypothetical protein
MNDVKDFAERVRKFYYYRALLCEKLFNKAVAVHGNGIEIPPADFNPFSNFSIEAYVISCAAIDGLASIWESVNQYQFSGNQDRFTKFLICMDSHAQMERICTPFLVFSLNNQGIEEPFANEVKSKWLDNRSECESHRVYEDPIFSELKSMYEDSHIKRPISNILSLKNPDLVISSFTYAALIYKFYRCSFVHEFRDSQFAAFFSRNSELSVREFGVKPQLDVGLGVLTEKIRTGADAAHALIIEKGYIDIPYGPNDEIKLKVKRT